MIKTANGSKNNRLNHKDELDVLKEINKMDDIKLKEYRERNKVHNEKIAKRTVRNFISSTIKRTIDIFAGLLGTILLIPITIVVAIMNKINHEDGPMFYDQLRIGKNGKIFKLYKFRSMVIGADKALEDYLSTHPEEAEEYRINKKLKKCDFIIAFFIKIINLKIHVLMNQEVIILDLIFRIALAY